MVKPWCCDSVSPCRSLLEAIQQYVPWNKSPNPGRFPVESNQTTLWSQAKKQRHLKKVFPATSNSGLFEPLSVNVAITAKQPTLFRPEAFRINRFHCSSEAKNYPKSHGEKSIDHLPMNLLHRPTGLKRYVLAVRTQGSFTAHVKVPKVSESNSTRSKACSTLGLGALIWACWWHG